MKIWFFILLAFSFQSFGQGSATCEKEVAAVRYKVDSFTYASKPVSSLVVEGALFKEIDETCKKLLSFPYSTLIDPEIPRLQAILDRIIPQPYFGPFKKFDYGSCVLPKLRARHLLPDFKNVNSITYFDGPDYVVLDKNGTVVLNMVREPNFNESTFVFDSKTCKLSEAFIDEQTQFGLFKSSSSLGFTPGLCANLNTLEGYIIELEKYEAGAYNLQPHRKILDFYKQHGTSGHPYNRRQFNKLVSYCKTFDL